MEYTIQEIHVEMMVLLKRFHALCNEHGIRYSVHAGTMIGAVREHGFIPWDDDIDLSFTRADFEKFSALAGGNDINDLMKAEEGEYFYYSLYDNAFPQLWMVRDRKPAVWIDFFVYDYISENKFAQKLKKALIAASLGFLKNKRTMQMTKQRGLYSGGKYALIYLAYLLGKPFSAKSKYKIAEKIRQSFAGSKKLIHRSNDRYIGIGFTYPKEVMEEYEAVPFEDAELMITKRYDDILIPSYGDYRTPVKDNTETSNVHVLSREVMPFTPPAIHLSDDELNRLRDLEFMCLLEFDRICKKHGITYFLGGGTLLGAVRHHDFIPWDDDIDVMMLPGEYQKFVQVVDGELDEKFVYQSKENDSEYHSPFDKIRLKGTIFDTYFSRQFDLKSHGIFIDIFVHDYISDNKKIQKLHIFRTLLARSFVRHKWDDSPMHFYGKLKFICKLAEIHKKSASMEHLQKKQMKIITKYNDKHTHFLYDSRGEHLRHGAFSSKILEEGSIDTMFHGKAFPIPARFDDYLKFSYGNDYMELPPVEKRVPGHNLSVLDFGEYTGNYGSTE